jgi:hypothetical protein
MNPEPISHSAPPLEGTSSRRKALIAAGISLALLLSAVGLLARGSGEEVDPASAQATTAAASKQALPGKGGGTAPAGQPGTGAQAEKTAPRFDSTICWQDLERFNEAVTIENFREWAAPLLAAKDANVRGYLKERLTELIGNDAGRALTVLGWSHDAAPKEFGVLMMALRDSEAVHLPQVAAELTEMGLDSRLPPERRAGILSALDTQKRLEPAALTRLADFAKDPAAGEAGWAAARTIGRVLKRDFKQTGNLAPYLDKLITIGTESPDEPIRYLGQMMPMHAAPLLDAEATERYAKILATEGNEDGRDAAAHILSLSRDKEKVLELFAKTFETDPAVCVRWAVFRFSARVSGKDALPLMANMAIQDPRFQPLYHDFARLYASGVLDWVRVWNSLPNQDPFGCLDRHD